MKNVRRKTLDEFSDESEEFESKFDRLLEGEYDELERSRLITQIVQWMQECANEGRYVALASAERRAFRSLLERWNSRLRNEGHYSEGIGSLADFDPNAGIVLVRDCPYPGLEPYTQTLRGSFFGRELLVSSCIAHLEQSGNRILLIVGASGSGKSSLVLAGVLPRLVEAHEGAWLFGPRLTPGSHPMAELAQAVAQAIQRPDLAGEIEHGLVEKPREALGQLTGLCQGRPLVLFVDQFEEVMTMCRDNVEQGVFARVLCALSEPTVSANGFSFRMLLTLRTDHLARFEINSAFTGLHARLVGEDNQHYISAIGFEDIKRAIKGPAEEVGLRFIPTTLIDQLASQTAGLSNGLPLLQFALCRLWNTRPKNELGEPLDLITEDMVKGLPDVERALGTVADSVFRTFSDSQKRVCERLLLELLVLDESFEEPLRRRRNETDLTRVLESHFPAPGEVGSVINAFVAAGLLRRFGESGNGQLEVAHEALLRHWDHIYSLLTGAEVKERLHLIKQIGREAGDWMGHNRSNDYLSLRGERLARAISYGADGWLAEPEATAYVDACKTHDEAQRLKDKLASLEKERADAAERAREAAELKGLRFRRDMWRLGLLAITVLALSIGFAWHRARKESSARALAMAAEAESERNPQGSLLLAIEAAKTLNGDLLPEVASALRSSIRGSRVVGLFKGYGKISLDAAAYTPDGSVLVLGDSLGGVTFWDVATGLQRKALFAHVDAVKAIAFTPDGRKMATGSADGRVVIWDAERATPLHVLNGHVDAVTSVAFSRPDGRLLATASEDSSVRIWNVARGLPVGKPLYGHIGSVKVLAFGRDERQLVSAGEDNQVVMWDCQEGRVLYSFGARSLFDLDLSTDGSWLALATGDDVEIWDTATRGRLWILTGHTNSVFGVRFSFDKRRVVTAGYDSTVRVWRLPHDERDLQRQPEELTRIRTEPSTELSKTLITAVAFGPTADTVAAAFAGGTAVVWNVTAGGELLTLTGPETAVTAVAFSPHGDVIAAAGDNQVLQWNISGTRKNAEIKLSGKAVAFSRDGAFAIGSGKQVLLTLPGATDPKRLEGHEGVVNDLAFSPDGSRLVSGSHDGAAIIWELPSGKRLRVLKGHSDYVIAVAFSPDGNTIATGSKDNTIILWHAGSLNQKRVMKGHLLGILDLAFTQDSKRLVSAGKDKTVRVWDIVTGVQEVVLTPHNDVVNAIAIHGNHLATGADDGIRLWDLGSLEPVPVFPARSHGAQSLAFSSDGRYLAAGAKDGAVRVYVMQGKELVELATKRVHRAWTPEECRSFLQREKCPRSPFSILDEAYRSFEKFDFNAGERFLREAKSGGIAEAKAIETEVNSRLGSAFLWAASDAMANPDKWAKITEGKSLQDVVHLFLIGAGEKFKDRSFDAESRWQALSAYQYVQRARRLARKGELKESAAALQQARNAGWQMSSAPQDAASQMLAVHVLSENRFTSAVQNQDELRKRAFAIERALTWFPDIRPGHRVAAELYQRLNDYANAAKHYRDEAAAKEKSAEPLAALAWLTLTEQERQKDARYAREAAVYAKEALARDPGSDRAWFILGIAEHALRNPKDAVAALDRVSPHSELSVEALNAAGAVYFEDLGDEQAAYQRLARAAQLAPDKLNVLSNYAEFLLASGRDGQARVAAVRAREHTHAQYPGEAHVRVAMSFVVFCAELFAGERGRALAELDEIDRQVKLAEAETKATMAKGQPPSAWEYKGTRRSLDRRLRAASTDQRTALLKVLRFVETNGQQGALDDMRRLLGSQLTK